MPAWKLRLLVWIAAQPLGDGNNGTWTQAEKDRFILLVGGLLRREFLSEMLYSETYSTDPGTLEFRDETIAMLINLAETAVVIAGPDSQPTIPAAPSSTAIGTRVRVPALQDRAQARGNLTDSQYDESVQNQPQKCRSQIPLMYRAIAQTTKGKTHIVTVNQAIVATFRRRRSARNFAREYNMFLSMFGTIVNVYPEFLTNVINETISRGQGDAGAAEGFTPPFNFDNAAELPINDNLPMEVRGGGAARQNVYNNLRLTQ